MQQIRSSYNANMNITKIIKLQDLPPSRRNPKSDSYSRDTFARLISDGESKNAEVFCLEHNAIKEDALVCDFNAYLMAFLFPYNSHGSVLLVPDDVWLMITLFLSKYINDNAQALRHKFVSHEGQKTLTVKQYLSSEEQAKRKEKEWDYFFDQIIVQIKNNTAQGVVDKLICDFSTTTKLYQLISTAVTMNSFKKYFTYERILSECGISNIYFQGTRDDWVKIGQKLRNLSQYDVDGVLKKYVKHVAQILDNFLKTFDGKVDLNWWNSIMTTEEERLGSGDMEIRIKGWILHFFGLYEETQISDIPDYSIDVPLVLINEFTGIKKHLRMIGRWSTCSKIQENVFKPDIGICIVKTGEEKLQQQNTQSNLAGRSIPQNYILSRPSGISNSSSGIQNRRSTKVSPIRPSDVDMKGEMIEENMEINSQNKDGQKDEGNCFSKFFERIACQLI